MKENWIWQSYHYRHHVVGWWQEGHPAVKLLLQNMTCGAPPRVPVDRFRPMWAVFLPIIVQYMNNGVQYMNNGGGRCGVRRLRSVGDGAWRKCCWSDRPTRASMEKRTLNCMID